MKSARTVLGAIFGMMMLMTGEVCCFGRQGSSEENLRDQRRSDRDARERGGPRITYDNKDQITSVMRRRGEKYISIHSWNGDTYNGGPLYLWDNGHIGNTRP